MAKKLQICSTGGTTNPNDALRKTEHHSQGISYC